MGFLSYIDDFKGSIFNGRRCSENTTSLERRMPVGKVLHQILASLFSSEYKIFKRAFFYVHWSGYFLYEKFHFNDNENLTLLVNGSDVVAVFEGRLTKVPRRGLCMYALIRRSWSWTEFLVVDSRVLPLQT